MDPIVFFIVLTTLYVMLFFFDSIFKTCMHYPYDAFLKNTGISVQFMRLNFHTTAFNRLLLRWSAGNSTCTRSFLTKSFTVGVLLALSLLPVGIILLIIAFFGGSDRTSISDSQGATTAEAVKVEILLPGINLPLDEIGYYVVTLFVTTIFHELGHALAAVLEEVPVTGFGFRLIYCLPLAYTEISSEHLNALKWFRKLRILCAGIWHNFLLASFCYLLISTMGFTVSPLYTMNEEVIITEMTENSPLRAESRERGLEVGNIITQINDCNVNNENSWYECLRKAVRTKPGYCVSSDFIRLNDESIDISHHGSDGTLQCCDERNVKLCCFEYIDDFSNDAPVEIPQHVCLDVRRTLDDSYGYCVAGGTCGQGFCLRPLLRNKTTILSFKRQSAHHVGLRDVIYLGLARDVTHTVRISPFVPKQSFLTSYWADAYALLLKYNVVFSFGLALINSIPCFGFDGSHITNTIINSFLVNRVAERPKRDFISLIVTGSGTLLFGLTVFKVLWSSVLRNIF